VTSPLAGVDGWEEGGREYKLQQPPVLFLALKAACFRFPDSNGQPLLTLAL
jgi:hypothetical protein